MAESRLNMNLNQKHLTKPDCNEIPAVTIPELKTLSKPHVDSFNYILQGGLGSAIEDIPPVEFSTPNGEKISIKLTDATIAKPMVPSGTARVSTNFVYPSECRQRKTTYKGRLTVRLSWSKNGKFQDIVERNLGEIPVMLMSECCNLSKLSPSELIKHGEDAKEIGGYFVINGIEKMLRMLIVPRRNYNMILHYLTNGTCKLMFFYQKEMFFVPILLILKALCSVCDYNIYTDLIAGRENDSFFKGSIKSMLRAIQGENILNQNDACNYMGEKFRIKLNLPEWYTNSEVMEFLLREAVCIHLDTNKAKYDLLIFMTRKLFTLVQRECMEESADNPINQELLQGGCLYLLVLKDKLTTWLNGVKNILLKKNKIRGAVYTVKQADILFARSWQIDGIFLATGNLVSRAGLGMLQNTGLSIGMDKINYLRFLSHYQSIHRGAVFADMRTTAVRKLRPEAWGFICPVHTPDGAPCGLLNHLTTECKVVSTHSCTSHYPRLFGKFGLFGLSHPSAAPYSDCYPVLLNGEVLGWIEDKHAERFCEELRKFKVCNEENISPYLEIVLVPKTKRASLYPGIFLFTTTARMMRPVKNLRYKKTEFIGTFEQIYLDICVKIEEAYEGYTTHQEIKQSHIMSLLANLVPFSNYNQSPRNMYQCQMAKQSMGTPSHSLRFKPDTKVYRLMTPQSPLVRPEIYDRYEMDDYATGTNAIVAIISYTGYDMEDAMVINKASIDRGFARGTIYKSEFIDLTQMDKCFFGRKLGVPNNISDKIDGDGLPHVGVYLENGDPFYSYIDDDNKEAKIIYYRASEAAHVDSVRLIGSDSGSEPAQKAHITFRIKRMPDVGDKFANRHGQKGVCSMRYPTEDLPFTESGMVPDIIFNPHGFPSRMTVGMLIETMAGKSAATHGIIHDATPFNFSEEDTAIDYFGECLKYAGFNYYGNERMYSGITGEELEADIFFGVIYYQRLRHMVADKYQVRSTGTIDQVTHQPIKGRKRGGGIRFGEMERDSLIAHGTSYLLQDRLFHCSDGSVEYICTKCGSLLSPLMEIPKLDDTVHWKCKSCNTKDYIGKIAIPFVFKYLCCELAAINIKVVLETKF
uniref:DNA-directed RNA polymerase subunit beta n=1 Tax=Strigamia maritima TaxID=126957 RepID=T1J3J6_STRMM